jgi:aryl-alcohol dehydrogenase-like predicted oxidoreductase
MQTRPLGQSGIEASVIAFGAWAIGGWMWGGAEKKDSIAAVHAALDNGMNFIDTAPMYGMGRSEEVLGKALKGGYRQKAIIATKVSMYWDGSGEDGTYFFDSDDQRRLPDGSGNAKYKIYKNNKPRVIRKGLEDSLKRLQTDVIDLLQTHWQDPSTPIADTLGELLKRKKEGKIHASGCCNASIADMDQYRAAGQLDSDQEKYSMLDRGQEKGNLPYVQEHKMAFLAYSPLGQGLLTGGVGPDRVFPDGDLRKSNPRYGVENRQKVADFLAVIKPVADANNLTLGQLAAAWTIAQSGCSHALLGARNAKQVAENAKAGQVKLDAASLAAVTKAVNEKLVGVI